MKNNKGITLIALVVTIIILLILAGVSITTLSGNGLFGRAESSAAKYQAASEAENSTISSILDKYDYYDNKVNNGVTVSWNAPIATRGSFINSLTPAASKESDFYDKQIVAIKPNGTKEIINPYQSKSTSLPVGTTLRFYYYSDKNSDATAVGIIALAQNTPAEGFAKDGKLYYVDLTIPDCNTLRLELEEDAIEEANEKMWNYWVLTAYIDGVKQEIHR